MSPAHKVKFAWFLLIGSLIGWPVSAVTWASEEPPFILGLSWFAITLTALDVLFTADVRSEIDEDHDDLADDIDDITERCETCGK